MKFRFKSVTDVAVELLKNDIFVFSPISYNAPWEDYNLPHTFSFWENFDKTFVERCDTILVLTLPGWNESIGVAEEIKYAASLNIPINFCDYETLMSNSTQKQYILNLLR